MALAICGNRRPQMTADRPSATRQSTGEDGPFSDISANAEEHEQLSRRYGARLQARPLLIATAFRAILAC